MELWSLVASNVPALLCMIVGVILVIVEMVLPGFGIPGITGIVLLILGILVTGGTVGQMLALAGIALVLLLIALPFCLRGIAKGKLDKTPVVLDAVSVAKPAGVRLENLTGKTGVTHTMLRPAGIAVVEGEKLNVVSNGEFIPQGVQVRVDRVEGNRIVVSPVEEG